MKTFKSAHFIQVSKEAFDNIASYEDIKNECLVSTTKVVLDENKTSVVFCNESQAMIGFIKKEKKDYFLRFGQTKRIYPRVIKKDAIKIVDGRYVTFCNI